MNSIGILSNYYRDIGKTQHLPHYPKCDDHIMFTFSYLPYIITKGLDTFYYYKDDGKSSESSSLFWYVECEVTGKLVINKGFKSLEKAIDCVLALHDKKLKRDQEDFLKTKKQFLKLKEK